MLNQTINQLGNQANNQFSNQSIENNNQNTEKIVIANWKMNGDKEKIELFLLNLLKAHPLKIHNSVKTILALPYPYLLQAIQCVKNHLSSNYSFNANNSFKNIINIAAQNCNQHDNGPYTGEVSPSMLKDIDCNYVILGHTERRKHFHESNNLIKAKYIAALSHNIQPVLCVGESTKDNFENEVNEQLNAVSEQLALISYLSIFHSNTDSNTDPSSHSSISMIAKKMEILVAYEPSWAIGTGVTPNLKEIENRIIYIKHKISKIIKNNNEYNETAITNQHMQSIKILYGGSVNEKNIEEIIKIKELSGVLAGNASLIFEKFFEILSKVNFSH